MTPREKATELAESFIALNRVETKLTDYSRIEWPTAKLCAMIVANEVLGYMGADRGYEFWTNVKNEIEKL